MASPLRPAAGHAPRADAAKAIHQRHFDDGMKEVLAGRHVMRQSPASRADTTSLAVAAPVVLAIAAFVIAIAALVVALVRP